MSSLVKKPISPSHFDRTHPLAKGLKFYIPFLGSGHRVELVRGVRLSAPSGVQWRPSQSGGGVECTGGVSGPYYKLDDHPSYRFSGSFTVGAIVQFDSVSGKGGSILSKGSNTETTGDNHNFFLCYDLNTFNDHLSGNGWLCLFERADSPGANVSVKHVASVATGDRAFVVGVLDTDADEFRLYLDGVRVATRTSVTWVAETNAQHIAVGRFAYNDDGIQRWDGIVELTFGYNRVVDDGEIYRWADDPYVFVRPRRVFVFSSSGITYTPASASAQVLSSDPIVQLGQIDYTPTPAQTRYQSVNPTVQLGQIDYTPVVGQAVVVTVDPTVQLGQIDYTPTPATSTSRSIDPTVGTGLAISTTPATTTSSSGDPTIQLGTISFTPAPAVSVGHTIDPTVQLGTITLTPSPVTSRSETVDPTVSMVADITPVPGGMTVMTVDPTVQLGEIAITPSPSASSVVTIDPTVTLGPIDVVVGEALSVVETRLAASVLGAVTVSNVQADVRVSSFDPNVPITGISITPAFAFVQGLTVEPTVQLGAIAITNAQASCLVATADPTVTVVPPLSVRLPGVKVIYRRKRLILIG